MSIKDCLRQFSRWEDNDDLKCHHCGTMGSIQMATYLKEAPRHLIVKLGRLQDAQAGRKVMTKVDLPFGLVDLTSGAVPGDPTASAYKMTGVIKHWGS